MIFLFFHFFTLCLITKKATRIAYAVCMIIWLLTTKNQDCNLCRCHYTNCTVIWWKEITELHNWQNHNQVTIYLVRLWPVQYTVWLICCHIKQICNSFQFQTLPINETCCLGAETVLVTQLSGIQLIALNLYSLELHVGQLYTTLRSRIGDACVQPFL